MEEKMKNLFEYLKEIYELKTRVVLDYKKFDSEIDIEDFKNIYENITDIHDFSSDISGDEEYFTIKYIVLLSCLISIFIGASKMCLLIKYPSFVL